MINVSVATIASPTGVSGTDAATSASGNNASSAAGQSAFQALLAPKIAAGDVAASEASSPSDAVTGLELAGIQAQHKDGAADADGKDLPVVDSSLILIAAGAVTDTQRGDTASVSGPGTLRSGMQQMANDDAEVNPPLLTLDDGLPTSSDLERFNSGPHRLPGLALLTSAASLLAPPGVANGHTPLLQSAVGDLREATPTLPIDLVDGEAPNAYLDRLSTGPHRLPASAMAAFGAAQLLKLADANARPSTGSVAELTRGAVDIGLNPALTQGVAAPASAASATATGFGQSPGSAAWGQALDQQVMLMLNRGAQEARIRLHPQEMGQLDIRLSMGGDRVDLNFSVQHAAVAGALQQHMPQLTQMLADQGLSLGQASVSHDQAQSGNSTGQNAQSNGRNAAFAMNPDGEIEINHLVYQPAARGLLDIFA